MYNSAQAYRLLIHAEVTNALDIVPHDTAFKTQLYKSICSIPHDLPIEVATKIREEVFIHINKTLNETIN